ncbi:MAG: prepilin-type N-terminal cleavage/methylation domain-containing protein [Planctomycetota bacterium]|jgi:hypothetical protein
MKKPTESGFTLVEVLISSVILIPILFAILSTRDVVGTTIAANQRRADAGDQVRRVARRVRQMARPGLASTVRVRATKADVDAATAAEAQRLIDNPTGTPLHIPVIGEWIAPNELDPRPNLQFAAADGKLAVNAAAITTPRAFEFELDPNELDNDKDDDGDGIVDEGKLHFRYDDTSFVLLDNVEDCTFAMDNGVLVLFLRAARRDASGRVHRALIQQRIYFRNN